MPKTRVLPDDGFQRGALLIFAIFLVGSCIAPPYPDYLLMQHVPTVAAAVALSAVSSRYAISRRSFALIVVFLCLHTLGARYLYSYVPYDTWAERWLGIPINPTFGWERNHYDRLVHFSYGLLLALPIQEFQRRHWGVSSALAPVLAAECILATSAAYELAEWMVAVVYTPDMAEKFLGQQGDMFDAQKDMALATSGAVIAVCTSAWWARRRRLD
ncbi:MAG: DUF2238 domain-containing protein [Pirellulales bacterium]|nr:DUF2238 domain-containing protein [Pirellulales bacterium]